MGAKKGAKKGFKKTFKKKHNFNKKRHSESYAARLQKKAKIVAPASSISLDEISWKPVEIPDTLEDYQGFYGLEEIDGVDVKMVDGQAQFYAKDQSIVKSNSEDEKAKKEDKNDVKNARDNKANEIKTKNNDSTKESINEYGVTELKPRDYDEDLQNVPAIPNAVKEPEKVESTNPDNELGNVQFSKLGSTVDELPTDSTVLPNWSGVNVSSFTLDELSHQGFKSPTEIQKACIPPALVGKDVIGKAMTGSGKTLAYGIPILEKALAQERAGVKHSTAIIFTPTRELATQVFKHLQNFAKKFPLGNPTVVPLIGGLAIQKQERQLQHNPRVLVATPGRCLELLEKSDEIAKKLASADILVFDEADRLVENGHFDELQTTIDVLRRQRPQGDSSVSPKWQTLVFSATFSKDLFGKLDSNKTQHSSHDISEEAEKEEVLHLLGKKLKFKEKPTYIDVNPKQMVATQITETLLPCSATERDLMLYYFLSVFPGTTLVFANSIDAVKRLKPLLRNLNIPVVSLHSSMLQRQRLKSLETFESNCQKAEKSNGSSVLVASDVAARGLDIPNVKYVVHYHIPRTADAYIHRSGRTARAGKEGVSVIMCSPQEASGPFPKLRKMVGSKDKKYGSLEDLKMLPIDSDIVQQLKKRLNVASKLTDATIAESKLNQEDNWMRQAAKDLGVDDWSGFGEDDFLKKDKRRKNQKKLGKRDKKMLKAELKELLSKPIRTHGGSYITGGRNSLASQLLNNQHAGTGGVMGYLQKDALSVLKGKKNKRKKAKHN